MKESTGEPRAKRVRRALRSYVLGASSIGEGMRSIGEVMVSVMSFGKVRFQDPEIAAILARSDRDALMGDWAAIAGDFAKVGRDMSVSLEWMGEAVTRAKERGDSVEDMLANIMKEWDEFLKGATA